MTQLHIIDTCMSGNTSCSQQEKHLDLRNFTKLLLISSFARETVMVGSHLSLRTIILTENQGLVSRNNDSNCRTTERWERVICL